MLDLGNFLVWKERFIVSRWCMAQFFEGMLDICVVGKLWRETLPLKDFLQFFFLWSLSSELFSFKIGRLEIYHGNWKVPYLNRKYIPVYTFSQTITFGILTFWGVFHPHQSALTFVGDGEGIRLGVMWLCLVGKWLGSSLEKQMKLLQLLPLWSQTRTRSKVPDWCRQKYREHQRSP